MDYLYSPYEPYATTADIFGILALTAFFLFFAAIGYVISSLTLMFVYKKAGVDQWKAWIPVYQWWPFLELGGIRGAWAFLPLAGIVPFLGSFAGLMMLVLLAMAAYHVGRSFEKTSGWWTVLFVFAAPVWCAIVGLDHAAYDASKKPDRVFI